MHQSENIIRLFLETAASYPYKTAIIGKKDSVTFAELKMQVYQTSAYFRSEGLQKGDRVLVFVPMSIDLYRIVLALFNIGATAVFLDEWVNKKRMEECCRVAGCKGFIGIFKARILSFFSSELRKIPVRMGSSFPGNIFTSDESTEAANKNDTALITFTTGSTGIPKAAKRTHGFLAAQFDALRETIDPSADDVGMPALPIVLLINLAAGCTSVVADFKASRPDKLKPEKVIRQLQLHKVTRIEASPFFIRKIAEYCIEKNISLSHIKKIFTGGAPVFPSEVEIYRKAFTDSQIKIVYGSTEAEPVSSADSSEISEHRKELNGLYAGRPYQKAEVKIIRIKDQAIFCNSEDEFQQLLLPPLETGEIIVSGPHVLTEYFNNEEALKRNKIFISGKCYHRTGDSGYIDPDGLLFLTGRVSELIHSEGVIISPFIYERTLQEIEGIATGTVIYTDKIHLIIEKNPGAVTEKICSEIHKTGLKYDKLSFVKKIPRDPRHNSKIDYSRIRKILFN
jgi:olefin beta-lactone synthetase